MKKKSLRRRRRKRIQWLPPTRFWAMPLNDLAFTIASTARSLPQAIARINGMYDRSGVCNRAAPLYHPEFCAQRPLLIDKVKALMDLNIKESKAKRIRRWLQQVKPRWHPPKGLFTQDAETIAKTIADASNSYQQAVARVNFYYNRSGFCNSKSDRYDPAECDKRSAVLAELQSLMGSVSEAKQHLIDFSGTNQLLFKLAQAFRSPVELAWMIYDLEDPDDYEETDRLPIVKTRFNTAFNSLAVMVGVCKVGSPYYRADICKDLSRIRRRTWRIYYNLVLDSWGHDQRYIKDDSDAKGVGESL